MSRYDIKEPPKSPWRAVGVDVLLVQVKQTQIDLKTPGLGGAHGHDGLAVAICLLLGLGFGFFYIKNPETS